MSTPLQRLDGALQDAIGARVLGMHDTIRALAIAVVARGHVLVQGVPGLGKTLLAKTLE
jgi:MoxR-like ATPase